MNNTFKLSDNVIARIVQILQEGFITGTDITDHMRMIAVEPDADGMLQLTPAYMKQVLDGFMKINEQASEMIDPQKDE